MADEWFEKVSPHARVTDRGLSEYQRLAHFDASLIPENGRVLNIGSGSQQKFEKELRQARPDVEIFSVDPSLALREYVIQEEDRSFKRATPERSKLRIESLGNKEGTAVALGQQLPIPSSSIDLVLDVHGPAQYAKDWDIYKTYLKEVVRVLRPGGEFHISHVYFGDPLLGDEQNVEETIRRAEEVFEELGLKARVFRQKVGWAKNFMGREVPDIRVGAVITK